MRDEDKPFVCYYRSWWNFNIWPRTMFGSAAMLLWCLPAPVLFFGYYHLADFTNSDTVQWGMAFGLILLWLLWQLAMTRWMKARAQMIKVD